MSGSLEQVVKGEEAAELIGAPEAPKSKSRRGDMAVGMLGMFMQMGTGLVMLPATAVFLTPSQLTFWSVFLTIQALNALLEFGFSPAFSRNFTYVFSGARTLSREGVPDRQGGECDPQVLRNLMYASQRFYALLGVASFILLSTVASFYIYHLSRHLPDVQSVWPAWAILVVAHAASTYFNWQTALLFGADRMRKFYFVIIASRLVQVVVSVAGLVMTGSIVVLAIGYAASILVYRVLTQYFLRDIIKSVAKVAPQQVEAKHMTSVVAHNAMKVGWVTLGGFLASRFNILSLSMFLAAKPAAEYAISQQALNALASVSLVGTSLLTPMLANARFHRDKTTLREIFSFINLSAFLIFVAGVIGLFLLGNTLLGLIHSKTMLPAAPVLLMICVIYWLDAQVTISTQFILTSNRVPYLKAMVATGAAVALGVLAAGFLGGDLMTFLMIQAGIVLAYNAWKWPAEASAEVGLSPANFLSSALAGAQRVLHIKVGARA